MFTCLPSVRNLIIRQNKPPTHLPCEAMELRLPERLGEVIEAYYGLTGERPQLLRETGAQKGITHQWISQLKEAALARLQQPDGSVTSM